MKNFLTGIQLYSLRTDMEKDFYGTLQKVKEMGYDGVEFAGLFGNDASTVKDMCDKVGLVPVSAHVPYNEMMEAPEKVISCYAEIGCKFITIPYLTEECRPGREKFGEFVENIKMLGKLSKEKGMTLCYHNHDFEFEKVDGEYILDIIYKEIPSDVLETQIDTCWANVGGENPAEYVKKYSGRAHILHLKDFAGQKGENMYGLIGIDDSKEKDAPEEFELRPVGYGYQNFPEILEAAKAAGTEWVIVEQDSPSMGKTPLECAKMSIDYLESL